MCSRTMTDKDERIFNGAAMLCMQIGIEKMAIGYWFNLWSPSGISASDL